MLSRLLQRCFTFETAFFLVLWFGLLLTGRTRLLQDPGTFWHTAVGQRILTDGFFDRDPYSFLHHGDAWVPNQWLCECLFALLHRAGGLDALLLFTVTTLAGLYTWMAHRLRRAGFHWSLASVVLVLVIAASCMHFHVRPHIGSIVFLAVTQALLCDVEMGRAPFRRLVWLVPLFIVWTNWHGAVLGGFATLALTLAGWAILGAAGRPSPLASPRAVAAAAGLLALCLATALVNPYGIGIPRAWYLILGTGELSKIIKEHASLSSTSLDGAAVLLFGGLYLAAVLSIWPSWPRVTWLVPLFWLLATIQGIRHAPLFAVTAGIALADLVPQTRWTQRLAQVREDLFTFPPPAAVLPWSALFVPVLCVGLAFGLQASGVQVPLLGFGWASPSPEVWPAEVEAELTRYEPTGPPGTPIFNELAMGGYLIYRHPGYKVFVDDRCELYRPEWLTRYVRAEGQNSAEFLAEEQAAQDTRKNSFGWFDIALTRTGSGFDRYFHESPEWEVIRRGQVASFYKRRPQSPAQPKEQAVPPR